MFFFVLIAVFLSAIDSQNFHNAFSPTILIGYPKIWKRSSLQISVLCSYDLDIANQTIGRIDPVGDRNKTMVNIYFPSEDMYKEERMRLNWNDQLAFYVRETREKRIEVVLRFHKMDHIECKWFRKSLKVCKWNQYIYEESVGKINRYL